MATAGAVKAIWHAPWFAVDGQTYVKCLKGCFFHSDSGHFSWLAIDLLLAKKVKSQYT